MCFVETSDPHVSVVLASPRLRVTILNTLGEGIVTHRLKEPQMDTDEHR